MMMSVVVHGAKRFLKTRLKAGLSPDSPLPIFSEHLVESFPPLCTLSESIPFATQW